MQTCKNKYAHRMGTKTVKINCSTSGENKAVTVKQLKHEFLFGCAEFSVLPYVNGEMDQIEAAKAEKRYKYMTDLFNAVTLPFYWGRFEEEPGKPDTVPMMNAAWWLKNKGMTLKGHTLCWHTVTAPWLLDLTNEEILHFQLERIKRDVTDFKGLIDMWDVINEVVIMPIFDKYDNGITRICRDRGRINLVRDVFLEAKRANPNAILLINDFEISVAYDILIEGLLEAGVPIDVIGIQSHMHQGYWGVEKTEKILARFSRFGLPLHFTENSLVSGKIMPHEIVDLNDFEVENWSSTAEGEARQAKEAVLHYETLFSHPLVKSITWWSFKDGEWLGAPSGLLNSDSDPKPAYHALHQLIKDKWWTDDQTLITDSNDMVTVTGFLGDYVAVCDGEETMFTIE